MAAFEVLQPPLDNSLRHLRSSTFLQLPSLCLFSTIHIISSSTGGLFCFKTNQQLQSAVEYMIKNYINV